MAQLEGSGGGAAGKLWRKHGGGYYALLAVGTLIYLEVRSLASATADAESVGDFLASELLSFAIEAVMNMLMASWWPITWFLGMGVSAFYWMAGGYLVWALLLAVLLERREKKFKAELGL